MGALTTIFGIIKALLGFGETIKSVSNDIARVRIAAREADTEEKKAELHAEETGLLAKQAVLVAEAATGSRWNQGFRIFISLPAAFVLWKIVVYDEMLQLGSTTIHSEQIWWYILSVVNFYLLNRAIQVAKR